MPVVTPLLRFPALPFTIGSSASPDNPHDLPNELPFVLGCDASSGLLKQVRDTAVEQALDAAYAASSQLGTAMDDTLFGSKYAEDFVAYIKEVSETLKGSSVLEIGAGRGYLLRLLLDAGARPVGIEPAIENTPHWQRHGVDVVCGTFPDSRVEGEFDLVIAFGVLEHIAEPEDFIRQIIARLRPETGAFIFAVPDCTQYIEMGDPSILVHEHFSYFTSGLLAGFIRECGMEPFALRRSNFGGSLYCAARPGADITSAKKSTSAENAVSQARHYAEQCSAARRKIAMGFERTAAEGKSVGIYCATRALGLLPANVNARFFDDDPELWGRFYPPFAIPIESQAALLKKSVDELWIMSNTFGAQLIERLSKETALAGTRFMSIGELLGDGV